MCDLLVYVVDLIACMTTDEDDDNRSKYGNDFLFVSFVAIWIAMKMIKYQHCILSMRPLCINKFLYFSHKQIPIVAADR